VITHNQLEEEPTFYFPRNNCLKRQTRAGIKTETGIANTQRVLNRHREQGKTVVRDARKRRGNQKLIKGM